MARAVDGWSPQPAYVGELAPGLVAQFRADAARHPDDPESGRIVGRLSRHSAEFARRWERQDVLDTALGVKAVEHRDLGRGLYDRTTVRITDHPELRVVLLSRSAPRAQAA